MSTAWKGGEVRATHRKPMNGLRPWRTRADPFESVWPLVKRWLDEEPDINAKSIFQRLQEVLPERLSLANCAHCSVASNNGGRR